MHIGDVVFCGVSCGEVAVCLLHGVELSIVLKLFVARPDGRWTPCGDEILVRPASMVEPALAWQMQSDGSVLVLRC